MTITLASAAFGWFYLEKVVARSRKNLANRQNMPVLMVTLSAE